MSELALLEVELCLETLPSVMASSCIALARYILDEEIWTSDLVEITGYKLSDLQVSLIYLNELFTKAPDFQQQAVQDKYKQEKFMRVAIIKPKELTGIKFD